MWLFAQRTVFVAHGIVIINAQTQDIFPFTQKYILVKSLVSQKRHFNDLATRLEPKFFKIYYKECPKKTLQVSKFNFKKEELLFDSGLLQPCMRLIIFVQSGNGAENNYDFL